MSSRMRLAANVATLANALLGLGAVVYVLAGNKLWAMLLVACGIGFDGLDGILSRRAGGGSSPVGRVLDSVADGITFGLAPGALLVVHTDHAAIWSVWQPGAWIAGGAVAALAWTRLVYFTWRGWRLPTFVGASTPQNALALILLLLFFDVPAFLGTNPVAVVVGALFLSLLMVTPIRYPKLRRGSAMRPVMTTTAAALALSIVPAQFHVALDAPLGRLSELSAVVAAVGMGIFYLLGPWTLGSSVDTTGPGSLHG